MIPQLKIVELRFRDWSGAITWFRTHLRLQSIMEVSAEQYALFQAGGVQLAIKGRDGSTPSEQILLQWEVNDIEAWQRELTARGVTIIKPLKTSHEGYRRIVVEGPEGLALLFFDYRVLTSPDTPGTT